jgi:uncharacterized protein (TIGR02145 family)
MKNTFLFSVFFLVGGSLVSGQTIMNIHKNDGSVVQIPMNTIDSITYTITQSGNPAVLITTPVIFITATTAICGGNITESGGTPVTQRGVCWSISPNPTTADSHVAAGAGSGNFSAGIIGLSANTTYFVRAYAINSAGAAYGNEVNFTTPSEIIQSNPGGGVTFDGYTYSSVVLGNGQEWMSENLRTSVYANGDTIPNVVDNTQWGNLATGAWVHMLNDSQYENPYGKLYNWYTAADSRNVCPTGWHVPSLAEYDFLISYLGGISQAGGKMKSVGNLYWFDPNLGATNESGFSGLPGGDRNSGGGSFDYLNYYGAWWTSTEGGTDNSCFVRIEYDNTGVAIWTPDKKFGFSIRCLKD